MNKQLTIKVIKTLETLEANRVANALASVTFMIGTGLLIMGAAKAFSFVVNTVQGWF